MKMLIQFELRKIFSKRLTRAALLAVILMSVLFCVSTYLNLYTFDGTGREGKGQEAVEIDQSLAEKYAGILTDQKVQQMMNELSPGNLHGLNPRYFFQNSLQASVCAFFSDKDGNWNGLHVSDVFGDEEIRIGYTYGWFLLSDDMVRVFLVLSFAVVIMIAPVFSGEYGGTDNIILTSRYGKTKCTAAKVIAAVVSAVSVTAFISAFHFIFGLCAYGSGGLDCSILFAPAEISEEFIPYNITCGTMLAYQILLVFTSVLSMTGITLILSACCKNQMAVLAVCGALYLLPVMIPVSEISPLFRYIVLTPVYQVQFVSLMSIEQMKNGMLYAVWAVPVAIFLLGIGTVVSRKIFARHQVS